MREQRADTAFILIRVRVGAFTRLAAIPLVIVGPGPWSLDARRAARGWDKGGA
jgi:hypothetical protein